jgi:hypothetical protein
VQRELGIHNPVMYSSKMSKKALLNGKAVVVVSLDSEPNAI